MHPQQSDMRQCCMLQLCSAHGTSKQVKHQQDSLCCVPHLEVVDEAIIPNLNIHSQIIMTLNFLPAQNELQSFINACVFAFSGRCKLFLTIHSDLAGSAGHRVQALMYLMLACLEQDK